MISLTFKLQLSYKQLRSLLRLALLFMLFFG